MAVFTILETCAAEEGGVIEDAFVARLVASAGAASSALEMLVGINMPHDVARDVWRAYQSDCKPGASWRATVAGHWRIHRDWETSTYVKVLCGILDAMMATEEMVDSAIACK